MANLKHTVVAMIAVVMISSLVAAQASDFSADVDKVDSSAKQTQVVNVETSVNNEDTASQEDAQAAEQETAAPAVQAEENVGYVIVNEGSLNVRSAASTDSEVIDKLACADKVTILAEEGDFYSVSYGSEGKTGYVVKASVTKSADEAKQLALATTMYEQGTAVVTEGALNIRSGAGRDSEVVDQLDNGDKVVVLAKEGEWLKVYYGRDYNIGYVIAESVNIDGMISRDDVAAKKSERIAAKAQSKGVIDISSGAVNVRVDPNEDAGVLTQLSNKENVLIMSQSNGWTKIAYGASNTIGYVKSEYVRNPDAPKATQERGTITTSRSSTSNARSSANTSFAKKTEAKAKSVDSAPATGSTKGQALVNEAAKYLGTKYVYGGSSPSGFDCSGLVQYACRKQGISVGRSSRDQFNNGVAVSRDELQPGDLVFFKSGGSISHVGIYAGNGQMIHSPQTGKTVCYTSINSTSRQKSYAGARRVTG